MMGNLILQMCTPDKGFQERLADFQFVEAASCQYADQMGFLTFGMIVYGGILSSIYLTSGSIVIPAVLLLVVGGAVIAQLAAPAIPFVLLTIILTGGGSIAYLYAKLSSSY